MTFAAPHDARPESVPFSIEGTIGWAFRIVGRAWAHLVVLLILQIVLTTIVVVAVDLLLALLHIEAPVLMRLLNYLIEQVSLAVAVPACMLEDLGPLQSCSRSLELTRGNRWAIFGLYVVCMLVGVIAMGATLVFFFRINALTIGLAILGALVALALIVVSTTLSTALYVALRRAEASPGEASIV